MKIFTLETKKHLVGWSILIGGVVGYIIQRLSMNAEFNTISNPYSRSGKGVESILHFGLPWRQSVNASAGYEASTLLINMLANIIFWIIIMLVTLLIIRKLRDRQGQTISNLSQ